MSEQAPLRRGLSDTKRLIALTLGIALLLVPVFANGYVFDDTMLIRGSRVIHDLRELPAVFANPTMYASGLYKGSTSAVDTYRPVTIATFMWDAQLSGVRPWSYHLTNLLAHLACVWLVYRLLRAVLAEPDRGAAWLGAAWFGLAPLAAEAHVWINGRSDVFATLFGLLSVLAWRRGFEASGGVRRASWQLAAAGAFLLGMLSKEVLLLCLPALVCWPETSAAARPSLWRRTVRTAPIALAALAYLALRSNALGGMRSHRDPAQLQAAVSQLPWLLWDSLLQSLLPTKPYLRMLSEEYAQLPAAAFIGAAIALLALAVLGVVLRRREPVVVWGLLWFAAPLVPVAIISTMHWPGFGRYLYLPIVGLSATLATLAMRLWRTQPRLHRALSVALAAYGALLAVTLEDVVLSYRDSNTLYTRIIASRPDLAYGYGMLAGSLSSQVRDLDRVVALLEVADRLDPTQREYPTHLAQAHLVMNRPERAAETAERALARFPNDPMLHYLAAAGRMSGDPDATVEHLVRCLTLAPGYARCKKGVELLCADDAQCSRFRASMLRAAENTEIAALRGLLTRAANQAR